MLCLNHRDRLSTSIVDKNDRSMFQSQRLTRQHSTDQYPTWHAYAYCIHSIVSSRESSGLANCSSLHVSVHCHMGFVQSEPKKLVFVPVASATAGGHRDCPVPCSPDLASVAQWPKMQPLVSRGQIVSADLPVS